MAEKPEEAKVLEDAQDDAELYTEAFLMQLLAAVKDRRKADRGFCSRLEKRWRRPLQLFEGVLLLGLQLGSGFSEQEHKEAERRKDFMFSALTRLHARSCLIALKFWPY